jgi:hypothetical protein
MLKGFLSGVKSFVIGAAVVGVVSTALLYAPEVAFAQDGGAVVKVDELVDFDGAFDSLKSMLKYVLAGAIGIGLAVWGAKFLFRVVKSMGRG